MSTKRWSQSKPNSIMIDEEIEESIKVTDYHDVIRRLNSFYGQGIWLSFLKANCLHLMF